MHKYSRLHFRHHQRVLNHLDPPSPYRDERHFQKYDDGEDYNRRNNRERQ